MAIIHPHIGDRLMDEDIESYYNQNNQKLAQNASFNSPMATYGSSIMLMTNPDNELYKTELAFRGLAMDDKGQIKQIGSPLMNNEGVNSVIGQIRGTVNQITIMSNLEKTDIEKMILFLGDTIIKDLMINNNVYQCSSIVARDKVHNIALETAFMCMRRAYNNGERGFWKSSQQEITTRVEGGNLGKKNNMFSNILGWGQKR